MPLKTWKRRETFTTRMNRGVGEYCIDWLLTDIESLGHLSGIHPSHFDSHRMLARCFPFGIYYREHGNETQVFAILDLRRNPSWIRKELGKRAV
jgi:hypothetical protein